MSFELFFILLYIINNILLIFQFHEKTTSLFIVSFRLDVKFYLSIIISYYSLFYFILQTIFYSIRWQASIFQLQLQYVN